MLDWGFVYENIPLYQQALVLTIRLALFGILGAIILGFFISLIKYYNVAILSQICQIYIELSRNTPSFDTVFYFLYYGLPKVGVVLPSELCAIVGLIFLGGSYMAESFRSGLEAVSKRQYEVGLSIGLSHLQNVFYVILPQAIAVALPSLVANIIFLVKETSVFSIVALADLMYIAKDLIGLYYETDEALLMLVVAYLIILLPISLLARILERRLHHAGFRTPGAVSGK